MDKRILTLAMLAATLATTLFGIPLALFVANYYRADERTELGRAAANAAIDVAADLFHGRFTGDLPTPPSGTRLALYAADTQRLGGAGPATADPVVQQSLDDNTVHHDTVDGRLLVAVPIADGPRAAYAVRASTSTTEVYRRILLTWGLMLALDALILIATWGFARWLARRLVRPLDRLCAAAGRLGDGDFSVHSQPSGIPEIDSVSTALNRTAERIGDLVGRERAITANVSHQLRTPLAGLRLGLEAALDSPTADPRLAITDAIASADRLENTIDDLTALARDRARGTEPLALDALLAEITDSWRSHLAQTGRSLRITADPDLPPPTASTAAIRQVLAVLVENAVAHGVGAVTVRARDATGATAIDVADEGTDVGHDEAALFDHQWATGHGIGLPLARSLAEAEGGRLRLSSRSPTTFTLFLPTAPQPSPAPEPTQPTPR
jgi:signal transduction histidine kinase